MSSYSATTLSLSSDALPNHDSHGYIYRPGISIPADMDYPHVNLRTKGTDLTIIVGDADAAEVFAYALLCAADNRRKVDAKRAEG